MSLLVCHIYCHYSTALLRILLILTTSTISHCDAILPFIILIVVCMTVDSNLRLGERFHSLVYFSTHPPHLRSTLRCTLTS